MKLKLSQACMLVCQQRPGLFIQHQSIAMARTTTILLNFFLNYFTYIYMRFQFATVKSSFSVVSLRLLHCKWYESSRIFRGNIHFILYTSKKKRRILKKFVEISIDFCVSIYSRAQMLLLLIRCIALVNLLPTTNTNERTIFWS